MTFSSRFAFDVCPGRAHPALHFLFCEHGKRALNGRRRTVISAFPQEENVFDIVLHDCPGLIWFSIKSRTVAFRLGNAVRDFVPQNWRETIEAKLTGAHLNVRV